MVECNLEEQYLQYILNGNLDLKPTNLENVHILFASHPSAYTLCRYSSKRFLTL